MRVLLEELLDDLAHIEGRIKAVNGKVEAYASQHDAVSRLVTIPGIGALGATAIVAAAGWFGNSARRAISPRGWVSFRQSIRPGASRPFWASASAATATFGG
ncbi:hypothetical protein [Paracoccus yeei]|uniref:hypothetical protein n=1 Tax=Paracoccus yeei TaxID=147645 RepID=UPI0028D04A01|nr:hypothetical protein [Paracoccus yeei]